MLPAPANTTCDIYHGDNAPPLTPDVAGVRVHLQSDFRHGLEAGQGLADTDQRFSHVMLVESTADIRDAYEAGTISPVTPPDAVYVPDKTGTSFRVIFVERRLRGSGFDHLRIYLSRQIVPWPTDEL